MCLYDGSQIKIILFLQTRPGYQPSGESDKENKVQERPPSASSSSYMSLSEPPQPLARYKEENEIYLSISFMIFAIVISFVTFTVVVYAQ